MRQLGDEAGMAGSTISRLLGGKIRPQRGTVEALGKVLGRPPWEIAGWLSLHDSPVPEDGLDIHHQMVTLRGAAVGYIGYTLWRARAHYPLDHLHEMVGSGILETDPAMLYEELDLRLSDYTIDEIGSFVRTCADLIGLMNLLDRRADERARQDFNVLMGRLDAMFSDENLLNYARQVQMQSLVNEINDSIRFAEDMLGQVHARLDRLPKEVWRPMHGPEDS